MNPIEMPTAAVDPEPDEDNPIWTKEDFARARGPESLTPAERAAFPNAGKRMGRPKLEAPKVAVKLRLDPDVLAAYRDSGPGWQTRMNDTLRSGMPHDVGAGRFTSASDRGHSAQPAGSSRKPATGRG